MRLALICAAAALATASLGSAAEPASAPTTVTASKEAKAKKPRKAAVIAAARIEAERLGAPVRRIAALWDALVESSIAFELEQWDLRHRL